MKIYSYISALLIAGIASFSSCSQEEDVKEMNGDNSSSGLQISAVSYTHLDVYKRQAQLSIAFCIAVVLSTVLSATAPKELADRAI